MNINGIIALLQLVLAMLSNPTTAQNPQFQALAGQAIQMAQTALSQGIPAESGVGGPDISSIPPTTPQSTNTLATSTPTLSPHCTINAVKLSSEDTLKQDHENEQAGLNTRSNYYDITWTLHDISSSTRGKLLDMSSPEDAGTDVGVGLLNQGVGLFPNENKVRVSHDFKNLIGADFNGTRCYANPS